MKKSILFAAVALLSVSCGRDAVLEPCGPVPSEAQLAWQRMEINMFCHFGPNTFSGAEWGDGTEPDSLFNPVALDCHQWVDVAEQAGMKGIILTAKHHDGFCLWPSAFSSHTVVAERDVLRRFVDACRGRVKAGVYISPWDRNHPTYGSSEYNTVFSKALKEVHDNYGPFFEQWFDGACGEGPNGKRQEYDWPLFESTVLSANPQCVIFSDVGPGCRWVGNEEGRAGETNWSRLQVKSGERRVEHGGCGDINGNRWIPAEVDVSIRPGWFWHKDEHPKSIDELMEIYYNSVGRNGLLLLNVPPDDHGRIAAEDSAVLVAFRAERDRVFSRDLSQGAKVEADHLRGRHYRAHNVLDTAYHSYWAAADTNAVLTLAFGSPTEFDIVVFQEYIPFGQRVRRFQIECDGQCFEGTTIGYKRIVRLPRRICTDKVIFRFDGIAPPIINRIALYKQ